MDHAATVRQVYDRINAHDVDGFVDMLADDLIEHEEFPGIPPTKEGVRQFFNMYIAAFPDLHFAVEDIIASGDKAVARVQVTGTQQGEFMGMQPTGKSVDVQVIDIMRFGDDGLTHEHWGAMDSIAMMQQLGMMPEGAPN